MQQVLIGLVAETETLQELVSQTHHFMHTHVTLLDRHTDGHTEIHRDTQSHRHTVTQTHSDIDFACHSPSNQRARMMHTRPTNPRQKTTATPE